MDHRFLTVLFSAVAVCAGFGGVDLHLGFPDYQGLNHRLTGLNTGQPPGGWGGADSVRLRGPMFWLGGHGAGEVDRLTFGGHGAATVGSTQADAVTAEVAGVRAGFETGYIYDPLEYLWLRPCLDIGGIAWVHYVHSNESFSDPNFSRWFYAWTLGVTPALEAMGRIRVGAASYIGLYAKAGYFLSVVGPVWAGDESHPEFTLAGFAVQTGVRFGRLPLRPFRF